MTYVAKYPQSSRQSPGRQIAGGTLFWIATLLLLAWWPFALLVFVIYDTWYVRHNLRNPVASSSRGVVCLVDRTFAQCQFPGEGTLRFDADRQILPEDRVLEVHISNWRLAYWRILKKNYWYRLLNAEFDSLAPQIQNRSEKAIVAKTILRFYYPGVQEFKVPHSARWNLDLDTFYMQWVILLLSRGPRRAIQQKDSVTRLGLWREDFCDRLGY